jgi:hypothetical protein
MFNSEELIGKEHTHRERTVELLQEQSCMKSWTARPLMMGLRACPETSANNYQTTQRNTPEE